MSKRSQHLTPLQSRLPTVAASTTSHSSSSTASGSASTTASSPPTSPSSSSRTLTPPLRLYLRTLLPTPPLSKAHLAHPPTNPYPWIWRCHLCNSLYRLGVTRRCLEDGHFFCSVPSPPPTPVSPSPSTLNSSTDDEDIATSKSPSQLAKDEVRRKMAEKKKAKKSRRRVPRGCLAEFDYAGWGKYNTWRREVVMSRSRKVVRREVGETHTSKLDRFKHWAHLMIGEDGDVVAARPSSSRETKRSRRPKRDCWRDCDFPSECHNERKAEREWEDRIRLERMRAAREVEAKKKTELWNREYDEEFGSPSPKLDNDPVVWGEVVYGGEGDGARIEHEENVHGKDNIHLETDITDSIPFDDPNLGPMGTDCDGLGEAAIQKPYITARRRSSVDESKGISPPTSPLKSSFDFDEFIIPGLSVGGRKEEDIVSSGTKVDAQLGEENDSRGRNLLSRRTEPGYEKFGDEADEDGRL